MLGVVCSLCLCDYLDYLWKKHSLIQPVCWTEYQWPPDRREGGWRSFSYPCWLRRWLRWYCRVFPAHQPQSRKFISSYSVNQRKYCEKIIHSPSGLPPTSRNTDSPHSDQMSDQSRRNWKKCLNRKRCHNTVLETGAGSLYTFLYTAIRRYELWKLYYARLLSICLVFSHKTTLKGQ